MKTIGISLPNSFILFIPFFWYNNGMVPSRLFTVSLTFVVVFTMVLTGSPFLSNHGIPSVFATEGGVNGNGNGKEGGAGKVNPINDGGAVELLMPIGGLTKASTFEDYIEALIVFAVDVGTGIATLWVVVSGIIYASSGGDQGKKGEAQQHIQWALIGLITLLFTNFILKTLNSVYYT